MPIDCVGVWASLQAKPLPVASRGGREVLVQHYGQESTKVIEAYELEWHVVRQYAT